MGTNGNGGRRAGLIDSQTAGKFAQVFLERGGKPTAICLILAALAKITLGILHRDIDEGVTGFFYLSLCGAYGTLVFSGKRRAEMIVTGTAELKDLVTPPGVSPPPSADPAINRGQQKIEAGLPPTGTVTPSA